jgi:hypothetical protein
MPPEIHFSKDLLVCTLLHSADTASGGRFHFKHLERAKPFNLIYEQLPSTPDYKTKDSNLLSVQLFLLGTNERICFHHAVFDEKQPEILPH